ncbi:hypothetical protein ACKFKG_22235 [Phormidesmis sp. 146-35]
MTHSPLIEDLLNALLGDATIAQDLTEADKATLRTMVQTLAGDLQGELQTVFQASNEATALNASTVEGLSADLNTILSELGVASKVRSTQASGEPLDEQSDSTLVEVLGDHVESASGVVEVLSTRSVSQQALNALRRVELQLTALTIGVSDLRQALEQNCRPMPLRRWKRSMTALLHRFQFQQHSETPVALQLRSALNVKPKHIALFALMLCIPLGLKLGVPTLLHQADRAGWLEKFHPQNQSLDTVESIQNGILRLKKPTGEVLRVKLAGLVLDEHWRSQAEGVMAMLLRPAQAKVRVSHTQLVQHGITEAIVSLPNGTPLQEVLLSDGLAKLNPNNLKVLPENLVLRLQQAETNAKLQHKNVWGDPRHVSPH